MPYDYCKTNVCVFDKVLAIFVKITDKQMAIEVTSINGVDKLFLGNNIIAYNFPTASVYVNTGTTAITIQLSKTATPASTTLFADLTNDYGTADAEAYADYLATNSFFFGANLSSINARLLDSEIVVKEASQLAGVLRSDVVYIIDDGVPMGAQQITVPASGLYLRGISNNIGGLSSAEASYSMFIGGGNLFIDNLQIEASGANSEVFSLTDPTGLNAVECTTVNFNDCTSLGTLTDFRQGLWQNIGLFGCADGLTLAGAWLGGFAIFTAIVRTFDVGNTGGIVLSADSLSVFQSRIISDANIQVNLTSKAYSFIEANFANDKSFQLIGGEISGTGTRVDGITVQSTKSLWATNGIPNTLPGGKLDFTVSVATTIALVNTPVKVAGTTVLSDEIWIEQNVDNRTEWLSSEDTDMQFTGVLSATSGNNNQIAFELHIFNSGGTLQDTLTFPPITTNGAGRAENVTLIETFQLSQGWYIELFVENRTGATDVSVEVDSRYIIEQIKGI